MYLSLSTHPIRACPPQPPPSLPSSASITADRNLSPAYIFTHATYATSALLAFQLSAPAFSPTPPSAHASFAHVIALTDPRPQFPARRVLACLRPHARRSPSPHSRSLASIDHSSLPFPHYRLHSSPKRIYPSTHHRVPFPAHCVSPLARSSLSSLAHAAYHSDVSACLRFPARHFGYPIPTPALLTHDHRSLFRAHLLPPSTCAPKPPPGNARPLALRLPSTLLLSTLR